MAGSIRPEASCYHQPKSKHVRFGNQWHIATTADGANSFIAFGADHWKLWVHQRWVTAVDEPGALTLWGAQGLDIEA